MADDKSVEQARAVADAFVADDKDDKLTDYLTNHTSQYKESLPAQLSAQLAEHTPKSPSGIKGWVIGFFAPDVAERITQIRELQNYLSRPLEYKGIPTLLRNHKRMTMQGSTDDEIDAAIKKELFEVAEGADTPLNEKALYDMAYESLSNLNESKLTSGFFSFFKGLRSTVNLVLQTIVAGQAILQSTLRALGEAKDDLAEAQKKNERLQEQVQGLEGQVQGLTAEAEAQAQTIQSLNDQLTQGSATADQLEAGALETAQHFSKQLDAEKAARAEAEARAESAEARLESVVAERNGLVETLGAMQTAAEVEAKAEAKTAAKPKSGGFFGFLASDEPAPPTADMQKVVMAQAGELAEQRAKIAEQAADIDRLIEALTKAQSPVRAAKAKAVKAEARADEAEAQAAKSEAKAAEAEARAAEAEAKVAELLAAAPEAKADTPAETHDDVAEDRRIAQEGGSPQSTVFTKAEDLQKKGGPKPGEAPEPPKAKA